MKNKNIYIYSLTVLSLIINLLMIKVILNPSKFDLLIKLGLIKNYDNQTLTNLIIFILIFSIITCLLLLISFVLLIKKLKTPNKFKF